MKIYCFARDCVFRRRQAALACFQRDGGGEKGTVVGKLENEKELFCCCLLSLPFRKPKSDSDTKISKKRLMKRGALS